MVASVDLDAFLNLGYGWAVQPFIRITRFPYEEPHHLQLVVEASNGRQAGSLEIYATASNLGAVSEQLRGFPRRMDDVVLWELGSERPENRSAFYFRFRVSQIQARGQCAIEVRFNNNGKPPHRELVELSIMAMPADLDRLASLLARFGELEHSVLEWTVSGGELRES